MKKNILKGLLCLAVISANTTFVSAQIYLPSTAGTTTNTATGNVGIGNATPSQKLDVNGNIKLSGYILGNQTTGNLALFSNSQYNTGASLILYGNQGTVGSDLRYGDVELWAGVGNGTTKYGNISLSVFNGTNGESMMVLNGKTKNVGIGTSTNPIEKLEVNGNIKAGSSLIQSDGFNAGYYNNVSPSGVRYVNGFSSGIFMGTDPAPAGTGDISFRMATSGNAGTAVTWNYPYVFKNNGNLGIGTFSPAARLHISSGYGNNSNAIIEGSVVIGASAMSALPCSANLKLYVNGLIGASEVRVSTTTWCDYVFEKDYKLKSLKEVENYIQANKHLPEVPSEKEVVENGVAMGEMMKIHMKKIEELTLYMIELQKQNEKLAAEVAVLKK